MTPNSPTTTLLCAILRSVKALSRNWHTAFLRTDFLAHSCQWGISFLLKIAWVKTSPTIVGKALRVDRFVSTLACIYQSVTLTIQSHSTSPPLSLCHTHTHIYIIYERAITPIYPELLNYSLQPLVLTFGKATGQSNKLSCIASLFLLKTTTNLSVVCSTLRYWSSKLHQYANSHQQVYYKAYKTCITL